MADEYRENDATTLSVGPVFLAQRRLATGLLALALAVWGLVMASGLRTYPFQHSFQQNIDSPVLALELARDAKDANGVLNGEKVPGYVPADKDEGKPLSQIAAETLRTNTHQDFLFIPLYTTFFWAFAALFAVRQGGQPLPGRWLMAILAVLTAAFDCWENARMLHVLNTSSAVVFPATPSLIKWGLFGTSLLLTAVILVRSWNPIYSLATRRILALAYGVAGLFVMIGLVRPQIIVLGTNVFVLVVLVNIVALLGPYFERRFLRPRIPQYVDDFCARKGAGQADVAVYRKRLPDEPEK